eukprot:858545-Pleurochrysis_carterae.AAC.2
MLCYKSFICSFFRHAWTRQPLLDPTFSKSAMLQILCGEIAWYRGLPLVQTLFKIDWLHIAAQALSERERVRVLSFFSLRYGVGCP